MDNGRTLILAHRGASTIAPENTMAAFQLAALQQADGLEIDITYTKDGEIVVIHDDIIDRTSNGIGAVASMTLEKLKEYRFNKGFEKEFPEEGIPTLSQVLELVRNKNLVLNIEVKSSAKVVDEMNLDREELGVAAARMVLAYGLMDKVIFSSFDHYAMVSVKQAFSQIKTGLLYVAGLYRAELYARGAGADALHPHFEAVNRQLVEEAHAAGIQVNPWTVDEPKTVRRMLEAGVDCLITNKPDLCRLELEHFKSSS